MKELIINNYLGIDLLKEDISAGYDLTDIYEVEKLMKVIRMSIIRKHINNGVIFLDFDGVYIDKDVVIGKGTKVYANNYLQGNTVIGKDCVIEAGNTINNSRIGDSVKISASNLSDC